MFAFVHHPTLYIITEKVHLSKSHAMMHWCLKTCILISAAGHCMSIYVPVNIPRNPTIGKDDSALPSAVNRSFAATAERGREDESDHIRRSTHNEVSLSPNTGTSPPPPNVTQEPTEQQSGDAPSWVPTLGNIITGTFRIIITVLTIFNVTVTRRVHGEHDNPSKPLQG